MEQKINQLSKYLLYRNHDTTYIKNYADKLAIRLVNINKYNTFSLRNVKENVSATYRPNFKSNLGIGIAYKWFSFDLTVPISIGKSFDYEHDRFIDFQANAFSSKHYYSASLQYYFGHQLTKTRGFDLASDYPELRDDIRSIYFALQYLYAVNYTKFSLKAPFILNEVQKKSAGSWLMGVGFNLFIVGADSSMVPYEYQNTNNDIINITDMSSLGISLNGGYMYSFVLREKWFLTVSAIPGVTYNIGDYKTDIRTPFDSHFSLKLKTMNAIGYNSEKFFSGFQFLFDLYDVDLTNSNRLNNGIGRLKFFVGYRFTRKKKS
ncbi:MAG: DUF4421 domain-containing protein [Reichenbachiella sp.]